MISEKLIVLGKNNLLKNACFGNITDNIIGSLDVGKSIHMQRLCQIQKIFVATLLWISKKLERVLYVRKMIK